MLSSASQNTVFRDSHNLAYGIRNTPFYNKIAAYIENGFADTYSASMTVNSPVLLATQTRNIQAALGLRNASNTLFSEQYLDLDIVTYLTKLGLHTERSDLIEISSLYSSNRRMTIRLLSSLVLGLYQLGYHYLLFTATNPLLALLTNFGLRPITLCHANQNRLHSSSDNWGTYYQTQPQVVVLQMAQCVQSLNLKRSMLGMISFLPNEFEQFNAAIKGEKSEF
jgi:hypothetical protein